MRLSELKETWDALAREDALGVTLSYPLRRHDWQLEEFFATGEREIADALADGRRHGLPSAFETALDFGCGVGRLTQALCAHFERCHGVDIAPAMIEGAERLNRHGDRCRYHLNDSDSLAFFADESFDLVYSNITLQHIAPEYSRRYVGEFVRVLRPGGLLLFQLPSERGEPPGDALPKLPRGAVLAEIRVSEPPDAIAAGTSAAVRARVRNAGDATWPARLGRRQLNLGNHWRRPDGRLVVHDDARAPLPRDVAPGGEVEIELRVTAPGEPGDYVLELDLVQEGVAWFAQRRRLSPRRSRPARYRVRVVAAGDATAARAPRMEMYGVPRDEVVSILEQRGARVLEIAENDAAGPGWVSLRYLATKERA